MAQGPVHKTLHDIVFEGRNKEYGAFVLLSESDRRTRKSLVISIFIFLLIILILLATMRFIRSHQPVYVMPSVSVGIDSNIPTIFSAGISAGRKADDKPEKKAPGKKEIDWNKVSDETPADADEKAEPEDNGNPNAVATNLASAGAGVPWGSDRVFLVADVIPQFEGGREGLSRYLSKNVHYPSDAIDKVKQGTVLVCFVVTMEGKVMDAKIVRGVDPLIDKEALRVVTEMPPWKPGLRGGKPVNIVLTLPIRFDLKLHFSNS